MQRLSDGLSLGRLTPWRCHCSCGGEIRLSKKHCLRIASLDPWPSVEIGSDEFRAIKEAKAKLTTVLGIEEKFALLVENYASMSGRCSICP